MTRTKLRSFSFLISSFLVLMVAVIVPVQTIFAADGNLLPNSAFSSSINPSSPDGWNFSKFGNNDAVPVYPASGPDAGTVAVKTVISNYTDGFSDWYSAPVPVTPFAEYRYTDMYMSDATGIIEAQYSIPGSADVFTDLAYLSPTGGNWNTVDVTFIVPAGATSLTIFHLINGSGSLSMAKPTLVKTADPDTFAEGMVSLAFDDGWQTQYDEALPRLNAAGIPGTFYVVGQFMLNADSIGTSTSDINNNYMNSDGVMDLHVAGHEVGNHTMNHCNLLTGTCPDAEVPNSPDPLSYSEEMSQAGSTLSSIGINASTLAYPYGAYNGDVKNAVASNNLIAARSVDRGYNLKNSDRYALKIQYIDSSMLTSGDFETKVKPWIDSARQNNTWLILLFHQIEPASLIAQNNDPDASTPELLQSVIDYLKQQNVRVVTVHQGVCMMDGMASNPACQGNNPPPVEDPTEASVSLSNLNFTYDGSAKVPTVSTDPENLSVVLTYDGSSTAPSNAGSYLVSAEIQSQNYFGSTTATMTIAKANPTITFDAITDKTIGSPDFAVSPISSSPAPITFSATGTCSISGNVVHLVSVGLCEISASQAETVNWNAVSVSRSFSINPVGQTVPVIEILGANPASVSVGQAYTDPGATAFDAEDGDLTSSIVSSSTVNTTVAGSYSVIYSVMDSSGLTATSTRTVNVTSPSGRQPTTGRFTFCLFIADQNNIIATTSSGIPAGMFSMTLASSTDFAHSSVGSKSWNTSLFKPNVNIVIDGRTPDAACKTIRHLPFGTYYYSKLQGVSDVVWNDPKYNDEDVQRVNNVFDFFQYSPEIFTPGSDDDASRNLSSDGQVVIDANHRDEAVMIYLQYDGRRLLAPPTIIAEPNATGTVGTAFSYSFSVTSASSTDPITISASSLPLGLSLSTSTVSINGMPEIAGSYPVTISAANSFGSNSVSVTFSILAAATSTATTTDTTGTNNEATSTPQNTETGSNGSGGSSGGGDSPSTVTSGGSSGGGAIGNGPPVQGRLDRSGPSGSSQLVSSSGQSSDQSASSGETYPTGGVSEENTTVPPRASRDVSRDIISSSTASLLLGNGTSMLDQVAAAAAFGDSGLPRSFWYSILPVALLLIILGWWFDRRRRMQSM